MNPGLKQAGIPGSGIPGLKTLLANPLKLLLYLHKIYSVKYVMIISPRKQIIIVLIILLTSALRLLALRGLQTLRIRRVPLRAPGVTQSNLFGNFFSLYKHFKLRSTNNFSYGSENMIFEIYTPENPMSTVESKFLT